MAMRFVKLFYDFLDDVEMLEMEERGRLVTAMLLHARGEAVPDGLLAGNERFLFPAFRAQLDRDAEAYRRRVETSRKSAMKRWRPDGDPDEDPDGGEPMPTHANAYKTRNRTMKKEKEQEEEKEEGEGEEEDKASRAPGFAPPTLREVVDYCRERGLNVDGDHFWRYYQANGWVAGRSPIVDWRAKLHDWEVNQRGGPGRGKSPPVNPALDYPQREYRAEDFGDDFFFDLREYADPAHPFP